MPAPTIIFRTTDALQWGDGKGANLTPTEADQNFFNLAQAIAGVAAIQPENITGISVAGNQMTIHLDGGTEFGPFTLPVASLHFKNDWLPDTDYVFGDFFTAADGLYLALQDHTSDATFLPTAANGTGPIYSLIIPFPKIYDIGFFYPGSVGRGLVAGDTMLSHVAVRDFYLPAGLIGTIGDLEAAATAGMSMDIKKGATAVGSIDIAAGATVATFTFITDIQFTAGDVLKVLAPAADDTAKSLTLTLRATLGILPETSTP